MRRVTVVAVAAAIMLGVWIYFRRTMPDNPPTGSEMTVIGLVALSVALARSWLWEQVRRGWQALRNLVSATVLIARRMWNRRGR